MGDPREDNEPHGKDALDKGQQVSRPWGVQTCKVIPTPSEFENSAELEDRTQRMSLGKYLSIPTTLTLGKLLNSQRDISSPSRSLLQCYRLPEVFIHCFHTEPLNAKSVL